MPDQLQLRGGTTTEHNSFTGALREVTVDTTKKTLVVHDGSQAGGTPLMKESGGNAASTVGIGVGGANKITINADGHVDIASNLDCAAGLDVTGGAITAGNGLTALSAAEPQIVIQDSDTGNTGNAAETSIQFRDGGSNLQGQIGFHDSGSSHLFIDTSSTSQDILCRVGGSATQLRVDNAGIDIVGNITGTGNLTIDTNTLHVDSSNNRVGIGTTSPSTLLHVSTNTDGTSDLLTLHADADGTNNGIASIKFTGNTGNHAAFIKGGHTTNGNSILTFHTDAHASGINPEERMRLNSNGKLLIGTTTESAFSDRILTVASSGGAGIEMRAGTSSISQLSFSDGSGADTSGYRGFISYAHNTDTMNFGTSALNRIVVNSSGKVGIGEVSPASQLHLKGSDTVLGGVGNSTTTCGAKLTVSDSAGRQAAFFAPSTTDAGIGTITNHVMTFLVSNTEKARMMSTNQTDPAFLIGRSNNTVNSSNFGHALFYDGSAGHFRDVDGGNTVLRAGGNQGQVNVFGDGDLTNNNNSYGQASDETLKQDIVDAASQWNDIKGLRVRKFRFKDNPTGVLQIGVVAQEIETVSAGLVQENSEGIKSVKYSVLYMKAVKCLQEAIAKIEVLETKVAALEAA